MSDAADIPRKVLSGALSEAIEGRIVRAAVFTTFTFDPGFFELNILPFLFDQSFSQVDKVKRIQLEDAMRGLDHLAVYYDRSGLSQDAEPALLDYERHDVRRPNGVFHPKVIMLLVDEPVEDELGEQDGYGESYQSLIVGIASANLTRSGWWENVECAHFEVISDRDLDRSRVSFRSDLLSLIRQIRESAPRDEDHVALDTIHEFVISRTEKGRFQSSRGAGAWRTRIFAGQKRQSLAEFLSSARLDTEEWNLEILSPFFDAEGAAPLRALEEALPIRETRVLLPRDADGAPTVTESCYEAIAARAQWSELPTEITSRGRNDQADRVTPRRVHAKVYRLWQRRGRDLLIVGSANLTSPGTSHAAAGNLEACFLVDATDEGYPRRWWLEPLDREAEAFVDVGPDESDGLDQTVVHVSFRFDWKTQHLSYRIDGGAEGPIELYDTTGRALGRIDPINTDDWSDCGKGVSAEMVELLKSTSFLLLRHTRGEWRALVREENMAFKPSRLQDLSAAEILEYWSLLSPNQRASFIELHVGGALDGLPVHEREKLDSRDTLFDRFAGIYHAFGCLERYVCAALEDGRTAEAEARLLGSQYDSLPVLLEKSLDQDDADPVALYVTFLCARLIRKTAEQQFPDFIVEAGSATHTLDDLLVTSDRLRDSIGLDGGEDAFFEWFEEAFLMPAVPPEDRP